MDEKNKRTFGNKQLLYCGRIKSFNVRVWTDKPIRKYRIYNNTYESEIKNYRQQWL